ncbi:hypothetical protein V6Z72_04085 [Cereibacter sphaeroides]|uniref:hypothetical protein n=1 Tax=Cereibacter sphaeroides TaxID=1063 RepID=UPI0039907F06
MATAEANPRPDHETNTAGTMAEGASQRVLSAHIRGSDVLRSANGLVHGVPRHDPNVTSAFGGRLQSLCALSVQFMITFSSYDIMRFCPVIVAAMKTGPRGAGAVVMRASCSSLLTSGALENRWWDAG